MADISIIANSGIQFYKARINLDFQSPELKMNMDFYEKLEQDEEGNKEYTFVFPYFLEKQQKYIELTDDIRKVAQDEETGEIDEDKIPKDLIKKIPEHKIITVRGREAVESYEGMWLPVPFLRKSYDGKKFQQGPETWARMWLSRIPATEESDGYTHNLVLAFDTRCAENEEVYLTPTPRDGQNAIFECATDSENNFFFCDFICLLKFG